MPDRCATCRGLGKVTNVYHGGDLEPGGIEPCPKCHGSGRSATMTDRRVEAAAAVLMGAVNAPERVIYKATRDALAAADATVADEARGMARILRAWLEDDLLRGKIRSPALLSVLTRAAALISRLAGLEGRE